MNDLPLHIPVVFILTTFIALFIFYLATKRSKVTLAILISWIVVQSIIGFAGFYLDEKTIPPRFILLVLPPLFLIIYLFLSGSGKRFIDKSDIKLLTILHVVRIPVEIVLFWLFLHKTVPELMTFEGRNLDILAGISAPVIYYFAFVKKVLRRNILIIWNLICIGLLMNIVINGVLSAPTTFQQFAFDQPNIALLHFPYILLPGFIVPLVLFSHLATIRRLVLSGNTWVKA